ncbi:MAG: dihydroneopterin aldolase [Trueperaceae bacterium]|nr:dihydroneopterin aldolase [Trueperaceae bacterium]
MARIVLQGLRFHAYHGVHPEELRFGAPFVVDLELELDLPEVDELARTVDYGRVYARVAAIVTGERHRLIEALAHRLARDVLAQEPLVSAVKVRVHKPHAPLPGVVGDVFVEVEHAR